MATHSMFTQNPWESWAWYLYRHTVCKKAEPNSGHRAIVQMEEIFKDRFRLVTSGMWMVFIYGPATAVNEPFRSTETSII